MRVEQYFDGPSIEPKIEESSKTLGFTVEKAFCNEEGKRDRKTVEEPDQDDTALISIKDTAKQLSHYYIQLDRPGTGKYKYYFKVELISENK